MWSSAARGSLRGPIGAERQRHVCMRIHASRRLSVVHVFGHVLQLLGCGRVEGVVGDAGGICATSGRVLDDRLPAVLEVAAVTAAKTTQIHPKIDGQPKTLPTAAPWRARLMRSSDGHAAGGSS